ncbi:MAG TPA: DEAD/DEAH box helicase [Gemmatimonadaceae bacterium]|nr:DEAD/DEAH box helicase [Gemmatimonadaceae bacterium]
MDGVLVHHTDAARVRAVIADLFLRDGESSSIAHVGDIALRPHQSSAVDRARQVIAEFGGALLADEVGLGKTFVAVALIRESRRALVVAPAVLQGMWSDALARGGARARVVSYDALSRGALPNETFDFVVLDEAHHARNPATKRYARLAAITSATPVLLLSATPVHNQTGDLAALLALFLGARAWQLSDDQRAACIIRRERTDVADTMLPALLPSVWLPVGDDKALLERITALPPPLPPRDGDDGGALVRWGLARLWASSHGALLRALERRLAIATALDASLAAGRYPSRATLAAWVCGDDAVQLAFPQLFETEHRLTEPMRRVVAEHADAIRAVRTRAQASAWTDIERAARLHDVRIAHPGEKVVAFSQFADTVRTLFSRLPDRSAAAGLTARGGQVAGGPISRAELLARFAPRAQVAAAPRDIERIDFLLTTDLLSEGINLQDASVVIHLDLPWTPARLEQRVGRARRIGSENQRVAVYTMAPPAAAEALLRVEQRLHDKLRAANRAIGIAGTILPTPSPNDAPSAPRQQESLRRILAAWSGPHARPPDERPPVVAVQGALKRCVLALFRDALGYSLAASVDHRPLDDRPALLVEIATLFDEASVGSDEPRAPTDDVGVALALSDRWIARRASIAATGGTLPLHAPGRRQAMRRIVSITSRAPPHLRPRLAPLAARARRAITLPFGIGAERVLHDLATATLPDEAWLRALGTFADVQERGGAPPERTLTLVAMLIGVA